MTDTPFGRFGQFKLGVFTGILPAALAANSEIFQFRWTDTGPAARFAQIRRLGISAAVSTTFFAAGVPLQFDVVRATGWTGQGTGGTAITMGTGGKARTSGMPDSMVAAGDIRVATTAALGGGTKTLDANASIAAVADGPITASLDGTILKPTELYQYDSDQDEYPWVVGFNEGFVIRAVAVPGTGTWTAAVSVEWMELGEGRIRK